MSKGITYVAVDPGIAEDPRILTIAAQLNLDPFTIAGRCVRFFGRVAEHRPDGNLAGLSGVILDAWAGGGIAGLGLALRDALADEEGQLRAWDRYNGSALRRREAARDRMRQLRAGTDREHNGKRARTVRAHPANGARNVRDNHTIPEPSNSNDDNARERAREVLAPGGDVALVYLDAVAGAFRSSQDPDSLGAELAALANGMHGPGGRAVPLPVLGRAIHEMQVAGAKLAPRALRRFCEDLMRPEEPSGPSRRRGGTARPTLDAGAPLPRLA